MVNNEPILFPKALSRLLFSTPEVEKRRFDQCVLLIKVFLCVRLFWAANIAMNFWLKWRTSDAIVPLWPVRWINQLPPAVGIDIICWSAIIACCLATFWFENRPIRLFAAISFFQITAISNSFGKINHHLHAWIIVGFVLAFFPKKWGEVREEVDSRHAFLTMFWGGQFFFMLFYSMSGAWKLFGIYIQLRQGVAVTGLHPYAFAYQIAHRLSQSNTDSILGDLIISYPLLGWLPYVVVVYFEFFAVVSVFRPNLHKPWAIILTIFHIGSWLTMTIAFNPNILLLGILLWLSPFAPEKFNLTSIVKELPIIRWIAKPLLKSNSP